MSNIELAVAIGLWLIVAYRAWRQYSAARGRTAMLVTAMLALEAIIMTLDPTVVSGWVNALFTPHFTLLVQCLCSVAATTLFVVMAGQERTTVAGARRQMWFAATAVPVMVISFCFAPVHQPTTVTYFWVEYARAVSEYGWAQFCWLAAYWIVFAITGLHGMWLILGHLLRYLKEANSRGAAMASVIFMGSCALLTLYFFCGTVVLIGRGAGHSLIPIDLVMHYSEMLGMMALLAGAVGINARFISTLGLLPVWWNLLRLRGLWLDMQQAVPILHIDAKRPRSIALFFDARLRLYRRLIEIRDGYVCVAPWYSVEDADVVVALRPRIGPANSACVQAVCWELARRSMLRADPPVNADVPRPSETYTLQDEIRQLRLAAKLRRRAHAIADAVEAYYSSESMSQASSASVRAATVERNSSSSSATRS